MRVLLIDDHHLFREGLRLMLANLRPETTFEQCGDCETALTLNENVTASTELILLDYHLPGLKGETAIGHIRDHFINATLVVVSGNEDPSTIRKAIDLGASGYIPKSSSPEILTAALQLVLAGGCYLPPHVLDDVAPASPQQINTGDEGPLSELSERQLCVLAMAVQGKLNKVIASELNIAEGTVKAHLSAAFKALGARNRTEAVYIATQHNLPVLRVPTASLTRN
ncbi:MAG: response regulator transcription factor [Pseudomonadota bacterium]